MSEDRFGELTRDDLRALFDAQSYVADDAIVTTVLLALRLGKPLLVEGEPGAGKTELAKALAASLDTELVRLQCYEGLTAENALYEWNYTKQLLSIESDEAGVEGEDSVFGEEYLLERPLLDALDGDDDDPSVLLVDEVDRADEAFEALLLEVLSDFQVSIPELGTVSAETPPIVVLTSNRTRALSDALKRRCLYLHVEAPSREKEREIVERKVPELTDARAADVCEVTDRLREEPLRKRPGVSETLDWARALSTLEGEPAGSESTPDAASTELVRDTLGCLVKDAADEGYVTAAIEDVFGEVERS